MAAKAVKELLKKGLVPSAPSSFDSSDVHWSASATQSQASAESQDSQDSSDNIIVLSHQLPPAPVESPYGE